MKIGSNDPWSGCGVGSRNGFVGILSPALQLEISQQWWKHLQPGKVSLFGDLDEDICCDMCCDNNLCLCRSKLKNFCTLHVGWVDPAPSFNENCFWQWGAYRWKSFFTMWNKGENDGYLAGMASSIAVTVSIGSLLALYVCPYQATMLSATSSLIGIGVSQ